MGRQGTQRELLAARFSPVDPFRLYRNDILLSRPELKSSPEQWSHSANVAAWQPTVTSRRASFNARQLLMTASPTIRHTNDALVTQENMGVRKMCHCHHSQT